MLTCLGFPRFLGGSVLRAAMTAKLSREDGKACYAKRKQAIEPVFGQLKEQQGARRSCVAARPPAKRSGSCCVARTTCSGYGGTPPSSISQAGHRLSDHQASSRGRRPLLSASQPSRRPRLLSARDGQ